MNAPATLTLRDQIAHALGHLDELDTATARAVANVPAARSREALLTRIHAVMTSGTSKVSPEVSWRAPIGTITVDQAEGIRRAIESRWSGAASRNSHVSAVRSIVRAAWEQGAIDAEHRDRVLLALKPWPDLRPTHAVGRHIEPGEIAHVFTELAADPSTHAIRDGAVLGVMLGCGPRRSEVVGIDLDDWAADTGALTLRETKGSRPRVVYPPSGARAWLDLWLERRGPAAGGLFLPLGVGIGRRDVNIARGRLSSGAIAWIVAHRFGPDVAPHDLRRTFIGNALDAGADLAAVQQLVGHRRADTTASYDRRGEHARRAANALIHVPSPKANP